MDVTQYQRLAAETDQSRGDVDKRLLIALLGLAGETGTLLSEHKKYLRDGVAGVRHDDVVDDLGDILWYLSSAATAYGVDLDTVARANLSKIRDRWIDTESDLGHFDTSFPEAESLPRQFSVVFGPVPNQPGRAIGFVEAGDQFGSLLGDNSRGDDGYRWHDAYHLAHAAVLNWSPVIRAILGRKRRSDPVVDDVEDGGRAIVIEEAIVASSFDYARQQAWSAAGGVDTGLLKGYRSLARHLEVGTVSLGAWERAFTVGTLCFRQLREHGGGRLVADLDARTLSFAPLEAEELAEHAERAATVLHAGGAEC